MAVATQIIEQLGGGRFLAMTGAKMLVDLGNGLQFKLPKFAGLKINCVRIVLNGNDLYDVEFFNIRGVNVKVVKKDVDVYAEDLRRFFADATGLSVSL